jgi:adenosine deaminase/aminodeoxyfutalosine deaminase
MPGCHEVPKAELHLHLEGSATPETMLELAPEASAEEIRARFRFSSFAGFLECFKWVVERLRGPEDYALVTRRLLETLDSQNVRYAEITLSAGVVLWKKQKFGPIFEAVRREAAQSPVEVQWNLDAIRHFGAEHAMQVAELAAEYVDDGAVSFGIGGDEERGPAGWFTDVYRFARAKGLRLTAHAGETAGPESVWEALRLGAERIGHGIRAVDDPSLMRHLRDENIPLEICISSNVATGAVPSLAAHPVRRLYDAGVPITLNTDDPGLFGTTLEKEFDLAAREFGFSERELAQIAENGFRYAFGHATPEPPGAKKVGQRL